MGVKSTRYLTRADAEKLYIEVHVKAQQNKRREKLEKRLADIQMHHVEIPYRLRDGIEDISTEQLHAIAIGADLASRKASMRQNAMIALADLQDDTRLENDLERVNDMASGGEGFANYVITENPREEF